MRAVLACFLLIAALYVPVGLAAPTSVENVPQPVGPGPKAAAVRGHITRPDEYGNILPAAGQVVYLHDLRTTESKSTRTDNAGTFEFRGLRLSDFYYIIAVNEYSVPRGSHFEIRIVYDPYLQAYVPRSVPVPDDFVSNLSWHQLVQVEKAGTYTVELDQGDVDPEFSNAVQPTFEPTARSPFPSWRPAVLKHVGPPPP